MCRPWHRWLLLAAGAEGFLALRSHLIPQPTSRRAAAADDQGPARTGWGAAAGGAILLGLYLARELFPSQAALQANVSTPSVLQYLLHMPQLWPKLPTFAVLSQYPRQT